LAALMEVSRFDANLGTIHSFSKHEFRLLVR
jgi:hypothetical protein